MAFIEGHREDVNEAVRRTVEDAVSRSDAADAAALGIGTELEGGDVRLPTAGAHDHARHHRDS